MLGALAAANPKTIAVLETGDPVLTPWRGSVKGLLEAWYPGEEGGAALASVLFGDSDPGGRLPVSFPASASQFPTAGNPLQYPGTTDVLYSEGLDVGYRWYDAHRVTPAYPFGFGLSYTRFRLRRLRLAAGPGSGPAVRVSFEVSNAGSRRGTAVPQVYISAPASSGEPPKQLKGYAKLALAPRHSRRVALLLNGHAFAHWDTAAGAWRTDSGCYGVLIGRSSRDLPLRAVVALYDASCSAPGGVPVLRLPPRRR